MANGLTNISSPAHKYLHESLRFFFTMILPLC